MEVIAILSIIIIKFIEIIILIFGAILILLTILDLILEFNINKRIQEANMLETFIKKFTASEPENGSSPQASGSAKTPVYPDPKMPGIPADAREKVKKINELMKYISKRVEGQMLSQPLIIEMEQMRDIHVPKLLLSYTEIPEAHRRQIFNRTGKSASVHLGESLSAILARLNEIDADLAQQHISTFENNANFIAQTYGAKSDPLA
jgi:hypothetical protein